MALQNYRTLLEQISQLTLIPEMLLSEELTQLSIRNVNFSLYAIGEQKQEYLVIHADMGQLPSKRREEVLLRLLDVNFFLFEAPRTSTFSRNAETGHMMMSHVQPLAGLTGQMVLNQLDAIATQILDWRTSYFLGNEAQASSTSGRQSTQLSAKTTLARSVF